MARVEPVETPSAGHSTPMSNNRPSLTLRQVFLLSLLGLVILLGVLFYLLVDGTTNSILASSNQLRRQVGQRLLNQVVAFRDQAESAADDVQRELEHHLTSINDRDALESVLYEEVLNHPDIAEATFTHARAVADDGTKLLFSSQNRWQISVYRSSQSADDLIRRRVTGDPAAGFSADLIEGAYSPATTEPTTRQSSVPDPTSPYTFQTLTLDVNLGHRVWSDLHWSELVPGQQRVEVTVQKAIDAPQTVKDFQGVVRVGLLTQQLDHIVSSAGSTMDLQGQQIEHRCFICDAQGRLITRINPDDQIKLDGDDLRISSLNPPPEVAAALHSPKLHAIEDNPADDNDKLTVGDQRFLVTFLPLPHTQDWVLAVLANEQSYLGELIAARNRLLVAELIGMVAIALCGALTLQAIRRGFSRVTGVSSRMREFDFAPTVPQAGIRDIRDVMESIEQAKTAVRAMGKYVPIDLVRDLYGMNREPMLGGQMCDVSIMFTDIKGFTNLTEMLDPDPLAVALGHYYAAMTTAIHDQDGTVDKYIGDSVMAIWNAPRPTENHPIKACAAALACVKATRLLFASPNWQGLPPMFTRYGLHRDMAMVGHFGAPDRMSYTAMGDGVNLASRLEGLNKQYGTTIMVSQTIYDAAKQAFRFRLLDRVAVKGKTIPINVYELIGSVDDPLAPGGAAADYESALHAYWSRDFARALETLSRQTSDPPSAVLAARCQELLRHPPPADWDGVYVSMEK
jgi:adenylate cyclase